MENRTFPLIVGLVMAAASQHSAAGETLRMQVSPSMSRAPALLTIRISVDSSPDNRFVHVAAESSDFYRSSEIPVDGAPSPALTVVQFRNLPSGLYRITGTLVGSHGPRGVVSRIARVEPPFGSSR